jgi:hypothetical protein
MSLVDQLRKSREKIVKSGEYEFTIKRPTDYDAVKFAKMEQLGILTEFVEGWNVKEIDIVPGGTSEVAPFSKELFREWIKEDLNLWNPLIEQIQAAYLDHKKAKDEALGKQETG